MLKFFFIKNYYNWEKKYFKKLSFIVIIFILSHKNLIAEKSDVIVSPPWGSKIPSIKEQLNFHFFLKHLSQKYSLKDQQKFEKAIFYETRNKKNCKNFFCVFKIYQKFNQNFLYFFNSTKINNTIFYNLIKTDGKDLWKSNKFECYDCFEKNYIIYLANLKNYSFIYSGSQIHQISNLKNKSIRLNRNTLIEKNKKNKEDSPVIDDKITKSKIIFNKRFKSGIFNFNNNHLDNSSVPEKLILNKQFPRKTLKFILAEKKYNHLIWEIIRKELLFYRLNKPLLKSEVPQARVRINIDKRGNIIWKKIIKPSSSRNFNKRIIEIFNFLKLPPPTKELVEKPPYVVTIDISG